MRKIIGSLNLNWKVAVLAIVSTTLLLLDHFHSPLLPWESIFPWWDVDLISVKVLDRTLLYFLIPILIILIIFREDPKKFGFSFGQWKIGLMLTFLGIMLVSPILYFVVSTNDPMSAYYKNLYPGLPWNTLLDLLGWEFMFRGWLLFGYARKFGTEAIWLQAVPFALAHIGKPEIETLSTIFGGFVFGWVAWRTKSFIYPLLIHWFVASFTVILAAR